MLKIINIVSLGLLLFSSVAISKEDEVLVKLVKSFENSEFESEIEQLSSDVFFIGNSHLISGDSGKALIYFKTALQMTPKHAHTINKKITESINVYKLATLSIPKENCEDLKDRTNFLKEFSPDSYHEIIAAFPECLSIKDIKINLHATAARLESEKIKIEGEKVSVENDLRKIDEFNKSKFTFLNLNLPEANTALEKKTYETLGDEISAILENRDFLPDDLIYTMQNEALKIIKIDSSKVKLNTSNITDVASEISVPINFTVFNNQLVRDEFILRYKQLLELKGAESKMWLSDTEIKVTPKVMNLLLQNRSSDLKYRQSAKDQIPFFPIFPPYLSLKFELTYKDPKNFTVVLAPFQLSILDNSFTPLLSKNDNKYKENLGKFKMNGFGNFESQVYDYTQILPNNLLKELVDLKVSLDTESTIVLNNIVRERPIRSIAQVRSLSFRDEKNDVLAGLTIDGSKEGLFYIFRDGKLTGSVLYYNDLPQTAGSVIAKEKETGEKYCVSSLCHQYLLLVKSGENYQLKLDYTSANCAIDVIEANLNKIANKWNGTGKDLEKITLRFDKDNINSDTVFLDVKGSCAALMGERKYVKFFH